MPENVRVHPYYFEDERTYDFVAHGHKDKVTLCLFHDWDDLRDEVFGFEISADQARQLSKMLAEAADEAGADAGAEPSDC